MLIIDDNIVMRRNIKKELKRMGHKVVGEADDGNKAIVKYKSYNPDVVTLDIVMPGMDGIEALKKLKEEFPGSKVVMVTSIGQKSKVLKAIKLGADHYVVKPIKEEKLEKVLNEVLKTKNTDRKEPVKTEEPEKDNSNQVQEQSKAEVESIEVLNKEERFIIRVNKNLDMDLIELINETIEGFLMITPLKISFDLTDAEFSSNEIEKEFNKVVNKIEAVGGEVETLF